MITKGQDEQWRFICMRHAKAAHNEVKDWHHNIHDCETKAAYKHSQQFLKTKFSKELLDPNDIDRKSLQQGFQVLDFNQIGLIVTSPLNRCLQTVSQLLSLFQNQTQKQAAIPQVIVDPCITSRISTAWSTGFEISRKKQQYPSFDFSQFQQQQRHWILYVLNKNFVQKYQKPDQHPETILEFISEGHLETYENVMARIEQFKWKLKYKYLSLAQNKKILIVSHSCLFKYLFGTQLNAKGKVHSDIDLQHCDPVFFKTKFILEETYLKPQNKQIPYKQIGQNC